MTVLPEPPAATAAGQATNPLTDAVIRAAVDNAIEQAKRHGTTPQAVIGDTPPVPQPGRPAMSSKAVDDSVRMITFGGMTLLVCGGASLVMVASDFADPTVIGMICGAPAAIALPILALARLARRAKGVLPDQHIHHYDGATVHQDQRQQHSKASGVIVKNTNQQ